MLNRRKFYATLIQMSVLFNNVTHRIRTTESDMARHDRFTQVLEKPSEVESLESP